MTRKNKKTRDRSGENFKKRWRTFQKHGNEIHKAYQADVYILLRRKGQVYEFKSTDKVWPLPPAEVVSASTKSSWMRKLMTDRKSVFLRPSKSLQ